MLFCKLKINKYYFIAFGTLKQYPRNAQPHGTESNKKNRKPKNDVKHPFPKYRGNRKISKFFKQKMSPLS